MPDRISIHVRRANFRWAGLFRKPEEGCECPLSILIGNGGGNFKRGSLSVKSRLRFIEYVKEYSDAEASKRIDERREQDYRRKQTPQDIDDVEDERPH
jgi:hypothetical protein